LKKPCWNEEITVQEQDEAEDNCDTGKPGEYISTSHSNYGKSLIDISIILTQKVIRLAPVTNLLKMNFSTNFYTLPFNIPI
jgi:hypothetical protein